MELSRIEKKRKEKKRKKRRKCKEKNANNVPQINTNERMRTNDLILINK